METLEQAIKQVLTKEARERFGSLKAAYPEKAQHVVMLLAQAINSGQLPGQITDEQFKELLRRLDSGKKDITITRK